MENKEFNPIHINAKYGEIANIVIMPGDPKRAEYIAQNFLEEYKLVTDTRAMYGYTGKYRGKEITVMGSGMGMPSMGIYSYELFKYYDVQYIIRIGSAGSYSENLDLNDLVLVNNSYNVGCFSNTLMGEDNHISKGDEKLNQLILDVAKRSNTDIKVSNISTTECFDLYTRFPQKNIDVLPKDLNIFACEMESFALFETARFLNRKAACLLTIVDTNWETKKEGLSTEQREKGLNRMIKLALDSVLEIERE